MIGQILFSKRIMSQCFIRKVINSPLLGASPMDATSYRDKDWI